MSLPAQTTIVEEASAGINLLSLMNMKKKRRRSSKRPNQSKSTSSRSTTGTNIYSIITCLYFADHQCIVCCSC